MHQSGYLRKNQNKAMILQDIRIKAVSCTMQICRQIEDGGITTGDFVYDYRTESFHGNGETLADAMGIWNRFALHDEIRILIS